MKENLHYTLLDAIADRRADSARRAAMKHYSERTPAEQHSLDALNEEQRLAYILSRIDALMGAPCELICGDSDGERLLHECIHNVSYEGEAARHRLYVWLRDRAAEVAGREFDNGEMK